MIFECKNCGAALEANGRSVAKCIYCGYEQTLPKKASDVRVNLYNRANHYRRNSDFDKAMEAYERILREDATDAEAYWSLVLCRYGIEYVEDPATKRHLPTVNRMQRTAVFADEDYKSALKYADGEQHKLYEQEANAINEIQRGYLSIAQSEDPFDIFICYKESDASGRRTQDSALATDLYHELEREGFKVFFSRITLEDKPGVAYEPYIYAALNSSKVMVVLGTKPEYFNAVWVKNEWSRYLTLIRNGARKHLIPAYRDMNPYDLPEEFSHLQALDMSRLGFMADLVHGIKKIVGAPATASPAASEPMTVRTEIAPLLKSGFAYLEQGDFDSAGEMFDQVINRAPSNARGYLGRLMTELRVTDVSGLSECNPFDQNHNYTQIMRYGDDTLKAEMRGYLQDIRTRKENKRKEEIYVKACEAQSDGDYKTAAGLFKSISGYKDADQLIKECREHSKKKRKKTGDDGQEDAQKKKEAMEKREDLFIMIGFLLIAIGLLIMCIQDIVATANDTVSKNFTLLRFPLYGIGAVAVAITGFCSKSIGKYITTCVSSYGHTKRVFHFGRFMLVVLIGILCAGIGIAASAIADSAIATRTSDGFTYKQRDDGTTIKKCENPHGDIVIPESINGIPVVEIKKNAFKDEDNLTSVTIPASVKKIGDYAFYSCNTLTTVTFAEGSQLTMIGDYAFQSCILLTGIEIPASVTEIKTFAFANCRRLATVLFAENSALTVIGVDAFNDCRTLTSVTIPHTVTNISVAAFEDCAELSEVKFYPNNQLVNVGSEAFKNCVSLTGVDFGEGTKLTYISSDAFEGCSNLEWVTIPLFVTSLSKKVFADCSKLQTIYYEGMESEWKTVDSKGVLESVAKYYYAAAEPTENPEKYWHYADGTPTLWATVEETETDEPTTPEG
ncbi:MAG: leucine-rich repeat protein [Clostridia bacterium]|nr:leucine-rich repeat protein [Clostridia bacterium]